MTQRDGHGRFIRPETLAETVKTGDRLASLEKIRDKLADLLQDADERTAPALAQRLAAVMAEVDSLSGSAKESTVVQLRDALAAKRARRGEAAAGP